MTKYTQCTEFKYRFKYLLFGSQLIMLVLDKYCLKGHTYVNYQYKLATRPVDVACPVLADMCTELYWETTVLFFLLWEVIALCDGSKSHKNLITKEKSLHY